MKTDDINIRRGQLINTFPIGSIITDTHNESFIVCSNSTWEYGPEKESYAIEENRLEALIRAKLYTPPHYTPSANSIFKKKNDSIAFVSTLRFPCWYRCVKCNHMIHLKSNQTKPTCLNEDCFTNRYNSYSSSLVPVRFIVACKKGHIDDFPFQRWVHGGENPSDHVLEYTNSSKGSTIDNIWINCKTCGKKRSLRGVMKVESFRDYTCEGKKIWIPDSENDTCDESIMGIQKGATNIIFPMVINAIYIPPKISQELNVFIRDTCRVHGTSYELLKGKPECRALFLGLIKQKNQTFGLSDNDIVDLIFDKLEGVDSESVEVRDESDLYIQEYNAFKKYVPRSGDYDFLSEKMNMKQYSNLITEYFSDIILMHKLRDTRVNYGFTRIKPFEETSREEMLPYRKLLNNNLNWLPAIVVRGEGVFLELNCKKVEEWSGNKDVISRISQITLSDSDKDNYKTIEELAAFILLHTLSHILIHEFSFSCGYNVTALKERIYYKKNEMCGILIYTSQGDSEGSLGGVVRLGYPDYFEQQLVSALTKANWCSSDPTCSQIGLQGAHLNNLSACHNCVILPDISCSKFNGKLDRSLLLGSLDNKEIGFFCKLL